MDLAACTGSSNVKTRVGPLTSLDADNLCNSGNNISSKIANAEAFY